MDAHRIHVTCSVRVHLREILTEFVHAQPKSSFSLVDRNVVTLRILIAVIKDLVKHSIQLSTLLTDRASFGSELVWIGRVDCSTESLHLDVLPLSS